MLSAVLVKAAIVAIIQLVGLNIVGDNVEVDLIFKPFEREEQRTILTIDKTNVTASNFIADLKTQIIAFIDTQYGLTVNSTDILIQGAPQ